MFFQEPIVDAGDFATWLKGVVLALQGLGESDVPCGSCIGCCSSGYFIHVVPEDTEALKVIPAHLLCKAPGRSDVCLMGHDRKGFCPMLKEGRCTIYASRPRTCRTYDCRIFAAAGIPVNGAHQIRIAERVKQWHFSYTTERDRQVHAAVHAMGQFLWEKRQQLSPDIVTDNETHVAMRAIRLHGIFLETDARPEDEGWVVRRIREELGLDS